VTKPKPCPFCGEVLQLTKSDTWTHDAQSKGTCILATMAIPNDHEKTVKLWNTRTDTIEAKLKAAEEIAIFLEVIMSVQEKSQTPTLERARKALQNWKETQDE